MPIWVFLCPNTFIWSVLKEPLLVFFKNVSQFLPNPQFRSIQVKRAKKSNSRFLIWHLWSPAWNLIFFCAQIPSFGVRWMSHYWTFSKMCLTFFQIQNTVFPHIVAAATILFWIHLVRKLFKFSFPLCNENLNSFLTRWGNYSRRGNYSREETIWGNTVCEFINFCNTTSKRVWPHCVQVLPGFALPML